MVDRIWRPQGSRDSLSLALTESQPYGDGGGLYNPYPMTHGLGSEKLDILLCNIACNMNMWLSIRFDTLWCEVVITFTAFMYLPQHPPNIQGGQSHPSVFFHILFYSCTKLTASPVALVQPSINHTYKIVIFIFNNADE